MESAEADAEKERSSDAEDEADDPQKECPKEIAMGIPPDFLCPITNEVMVDPVMAADGHSYERCAIERWFDLGHHTSPKTNAALDSQVLIANHNLRGGISDLIERMPGVKL